MARVTIEKCLKHGIKDKFDLVLIASKRSKDIERGKKPVIADKVKNTLVSLMEIEQEKLDIEQVKSEIVAKFRKYGVDASDDEQLNEVDVYNNLMSLGSEKAEEDEDETEDVDAEDTEEEDFCPEEDIIDELDDTEEEKEE